MPAVFISYSRRDKDFVERLHTALRDREYDVWVDWEDIPPSAEWFDEVRGGIRGADGVIYVISPDSAASEICTAELQHAVVQHKRIVPVVCRETTAGAVPEAAAALNWVFLRDGDDFDAGVDTLVRALETDLEHVRTHTRLGVEAQRWEASGRERSQLLRGAELSEAESWLVAAAEKEPAPTQLQREYLHASRASATRRQRGIIGAVSLALAVAIALGVIALIARNQAQNDLVRAKAALQIGDADLSLTTDPQRSVAHALDAAHARPDTQSAAALREALAASHLLRRFSWDDASLRPDALWSPNGTRLLIASPQVSTTIYQPGSDARPITLPAETTPVDVAWDADSNRVLIGGVHPAVYDAASGRLIARLPGVAMNVALSRDGTLAATTDNNYVGHVYDVATGRQVAAFHPSFRGGVTCFAWAPDDAVIAQCDAETTSDATAPASLDLWNASTGKLLHSDRTPYFVDSVAFSPNSQEYAYTTTTTAVQTPGTFVDSTSTGAQLKTFPGSGVDAVFSPDGSQLAYSTLVSDLVYVYTFKSGASQPLVGATAAVDTLNWNAAGTEIVAASEDGLGRVYDLLTGGNDIETLADGDNGTMREASFGLGGSEIATTSDDQTARLWASPNPSPTAQTTLTGGGWPASTAGFTTNGKEVLEAGLFGDGEVLDARNLRLVARFAAPPGWRFAGAGASGDGSIIAALAFTVSAGKVAGALVETFDGRTGKLLATVRPPPGTTLTDAALDRAGNRLATIYENGGADEWDPRTGRLLAHLDHGSSPAVLLGYSRDGSLLAVLHEPALPTTKTFPLGKTFAPVTIDLWNPHSGRLVRTMTGPNLTPLIPGISQFAPVAIAFSANGHLIALVGADTNVWAFNTRTGKGAYLEIPQHGVGVSVAWSPNGKLLAVGSGAEAFVWSISPSAPPALVAQLQQADPSTYSVLIGSSVEVGFTSNSQQLVTLGDNALEAWEISDQLQLFDTFAERGAINLAGSELVASSANRLSIYPCTLCGGLPRLLAAAKRVPAG